MEIEPAQSGINKSCPAAALLQSLKSANEIIGDLAWELARERSKQTVDVPPKQARPEVAIIPNGNNIYLIEKRYATPDGKPSRTYMSGSLACAVETARVYAASLVGEPACPPDPPPVKLTLGGWLAKLLFGWLPP